MLQQPDNVGVILIKNVVPREPDVSKAGPQKRTGMLRDPWEPTDEAPPRLASASGLVWTGLVLVSNDLLLSLPSDGPLIQQKLPFFFKLLNIFHLGEASLGLGQVEEEA